MVSEKLYNIVACLPASMLTEIDIDNRLTKSESDCIIVDLELAEKVEKIAGKHEKNNLKFKIVVTDRGLSNGKECHAVLFFVNFVLLGSNERYNFTTS